METRSCILKSYKQDLDYVYSNTQLCTLYSNSALLFIAAAVTLSLLTTSTALTTPAVASSKGGGSVVQEQVNTGNSGLDIEINKFYNCISKTHQDPPSINKVDNCYSQAFGGGYSGGSTTNSGATHRHRASIIINMATAQVMAG